jgi:hypothetical protein
MYATNRLSVKFGPQNSARTQHKDTKGNFMQSSVKTLALHYAEFPGVSENTF